MNKKEASYELQLIDANCNDCRFMVRDIDTYKKWASWHEEMDRKEFERGKALGHIRSDAKFQFEKAFLLNYGHCQKFNKQVSFVPGICQIETQECFEHRLSVLTPELRQKRFNS